MASGSKVWGNDLGGEHNGENYNGEYQNDKPNRLTTPDYDVSNYDEVLLVYKRWLHVEDGFYDNANVLANGEVIWTNHATRYEVGDEHHRDQQWQQRGSYSVCRSGNHEFFVGDRFRCGIDHGRMDSR